MTDGVSGFHDTEAMMHVVIVGAGLGGLAAAIGIAKAGHQITILEQAGALGEVCITLQRNISSS